MKESARKYPINVLSFEHPETGKKYFTPECDVIFRNLISKAENTTIPQKFAEGIIEKEIGGVTVNLNRDFPIDSVEDKEMEADVRMVSNKNGGIYIFEMQTSAPKDITKRFSAYVGSAYKSEIKSGMLYEKIPPLTLVIIMTKNIPKFKNVKRYHSVWNGREEVFKDVVFEEEIAIHVIELPKYIEHKKKTNEINIWLEFIINPLGEEVRNAMRTKEELRLAVDMLHLLNSDDQVRRMAFKEEFDEIDRLAEIKEGREEGVQAGKKDIIKKMIENGATVEQLAKMLNVEVEEIENMIIESE